MRTQKSILLVVSSAWYLVSLSNVYAIDNDPNKQYPLMEQNGPWMVMVATFSDVEDEQRKKQGMTAEDAADELVHELRSKGIPAYTFSQELKKEKIKTYDRLGHTNKRVFAAQREMICVLAGNYPKIEDALAQKTLTFIKRYQPKFMADKKSGAVVRDAKDPFRGAFLTINPMLEPEDIASRKADQQTRVLNSGIDYPLVKLDRKYTLKIATFTGKSVVPLGSSKYRGNEANFEKSLSQSGPYNLARAGEDATQLTYTLRQNSRATQALGRPRFEAFVYHDRFQSIVTVGGFNSENDPEIRRLADIFRAKYKTDSQVEYTPKGEYLLIAESLSLPNTIPDAPPVHTWAFDPVPELIEVPRIK